MRIIVNGAGGRMGNEVIKMAQAGMRGAEMAAAVDINGCNVTGCAVAKSLDEYEGSADCIVDFTHHTVTAGLLEYAKKRRVVRIQLLYFVISRIFVFNACCYISNLTNSIVSSHNLVFYKIFFIIFLWFCSNLIFKSD